MSLCKQLRTYPSPNPTKLARPSGIYPLLSIIIHLSILYVFISDRTSLIFKHLHNSSQCHTLCSDECFSILDHASTTFQLKIKEVIHIQWEKPTLTHRPYHVNLQLSL